MAAVGGGGRALPFLTIGRAACPDPKPVAAPDPVSCPTSWSARSPRAGHQERPASVVRASSWTTLGRRRPRSSCAWKRAGCAGSSRTTAPIVADELPLAAPPRHGVRSRRWPSSRASRVTMGFSGRRRWRRSRRLPALDHQPHRGRAPATRIKRRAASHPMARGASARPSRCANSSSPPARRKFLKTEATEFARMPLRRCAARAGAARGRLRGLARRRLVQQWRAATAGARAQEQRLPRGARRRAFVAQSRDVTGRPRNASDHDRAGTPDAASLAHRSAVPVQQHARCATGCSRIGIRSAYEAIVLHGLRQPSYGDSSTSRRTASTSTCTRRRSRSAFCNGREVHQALEPAAVRAALAPTRCGDGQAARLNRLRRRRARRHPLAYAPIATLWQTDLVPEGKRPCSLRRACAALVRRRTGGRPQATPNCRSAARWPSASSALTSWPREPQGLVIVDMHRTTRVVHERIGRRRGAGHQTQPLADPAVVRRDGRGDPRPRRRSPARTRGAGWTWRRCRPDDPRRASSRLLLAGGDGVAPRRARCSPSYSTSTPRACSSARSMNCWPAWSRHGAVRAQPSAHGRRDERTASRDMDQAYDRPPRPGARSRCARARRAVPARAMSAARLHRADWSGCARGTPDFRRNSAPGLSARRWTTASGSALVLLLLVLDPAVPADLHPDHARGVPAGTPARWSRCAVDVCRTVLLVFMFLSGDAFLRLMRLSDALARVPAGSGSGAGMIFASGGSVYGIEEGASLLSFVCHCRCSPGRRRWRRCCCSRRASRRG